MGLINKKTGEIFLQEAIDLLYSVGIDTFIKYYYVFEENKYNDSIESIVDTFKKNNEQWSEATMKLKAQFGKQLFVSEIEDIGTSFALEALLYIFHCSKKVCDEVKEQAGEILRKIDEKIDRELTAFSDAYSDDEDFMEYRLQLSEKPLYSSKA
jgi:hypothetical protein